MCLRDSKKNILNGDKMPVKHTGKPGDVDEPIVAWNFTKKKKEKRKKLKKGRKMKREKK